MVEELKIIMLCNIIVIYTRPEILLGLKLSCHTDALTETTNLVDQIKNRGEFQNEQQYRNGLKKIPYPINGTT